MKKTVYGGRDMNAMKSRGKKYLQILLCAVMVIGLGLLLMAPAMAEEDTVTLGTGSIVPGNKVWFGGYLWKVLRNENGKALLITDQTLEKIQFNPDRTAERAGGWYGSNAQQWCERFYTNEFEGIEKEAIQFTASVIEYLFKPDQSYQFGFCSYLPGDHIFFLSMEEVATLFADNDDRDTGTYWWTRSTIGTEAEMSYEYVGVVIPDGYLFFNYVDGGPYSGFLPAARPAFNLDLNAALFTSEISSGSNQYKMTLLDSETKISVDSDDVSRRGNTIMMPFSLTMSNEASDAKVSVLITDNAWSAGTNMTEGFTFLDVNVQDFGASALGTFILPDAYADKICGTDYYAYILAVDENSEHESDYAGIPVQISVPAPHIHNWTYTENGASVTAKCDDDCPFGYNTNGITLTLREAQDLMYDGNAKAATITGYPETAPSGLAEEPATITYYPSAGPGSTVISGSALDGAPSDAGDYVAEMTWGGKTARLAIGIAGLRITAAAPDVDISYDGQPHGIEVSVTEPESGYTVKYGTAEGTYDLTASPGITNVSDSPMTVWYQVTAKNYFPCMGSATVTIRKAANPAHVYTDAEVTKGGYTVNLSGNVELKGATGAISYAISGEANGCKLNGSELTTGEATGTVNVTVTVAEDANYLAMDAKTITVTILDREPAGNLTWSGDENGRFDYLWIDEEGEGTWGGGRNVLAGQTVQLVWVCEEGYVADTFSVKTANDEAVAWTFGLDADNRRVIRFVMPDEAVHVAMTSRPFTFDRADLVLPADTDSIEQSAFEGDCQITSVIIPAGCKSIGKWAFKDCKNLQHIRIPAGCSVGADAFTGCPWVYIYGSNGSPAWQYCQDHEENCRFVEEPVQE